MIKTQMMKPIDMMHVTEESTRLLVYITQESKVDVSIYSEERLLAEATLVQIGTNMTLQIEEVL